MKGNPKVIGQLQEALTAELTAVHQFLLHGEMLRDWGFEKLAGHALEEAKEEMEHARRFMERILFLEGNPVVATLSEVQIGADPKAQFDSDLALEIDQVQRLNKAVVVARAEEDNTSRELFEQVLKDEESHVDWIEAQLDLVRMTGIENYLSEQMN